MDTIDLTDMNAVTYVDLNDSRLPELTVASTADFGSTDDVGTLELRGLQAYGLPDGLYPYWVKDGTTLALALASACGADGVTAVSALARPVFADQSATVIGVEVLTTYTAELTFSDPDYFLDDVTFIASTTLDGDEGITDGVYLAERKSGESDVWTLYGTSGESAFEVGSYGPVSYAVTACAKAAPHLIVNSPPSTPAAPDNITPVVS